MGLTNRKEDQLREQPIIRSRVFKSQKGDHIVWQTTITEIKPLAYMTAVMENDPLAPEEELEVFVAA